MVDPHDELTRLTQLAQALRLLQAQMETQTRLLKLLGEMLGAEPEDPAPRCPKHPEETVFFGKVYCPDCLSEAELDSREPTGATE